jgi:hypothetical protein
MMAWLEIGPQKLLRHPAEETGISLGSSFTTKRLMEFHVPGLKEPDYAARIQCYSWLLQNVHNEVIDSHLRS